LVGAVGHRQRSIRGSPRIGGLMHLGRIDVGELDRVVAGHPATVPAKLAALSSCNVPVLPRGGGSGQQAAPHHWLELGLENWMLGPRYAQLLLEITPNFIVGGGDASRGMAVMTDEERMGPFERPSRVKALLKQLRDDNPDWPPDDVMREWKKLVLQDESLEQEVAELAFEHMWRTAL
jgi:hypothetical protein